MIPFFRFALMAIILLVLMRLAWRAIHFIEPGNRIRKELLRYFPLVEFVLYIWLLFRGTAIALEDFTYYNVVMISMAVAVVIAAGWYLLRDFLSGMVLRTENSFEKGQYLSTEVASGKITKLGYRSLELETDNGERIRIPWSRLNMLLLTIPSAEDSSHSHVLEILIERKGSPGIIRQQISSRLLNMPWVITGIPPRVSVEVHGQDQYIVTVRFNVLKKDHVILVEQNLRQFSREGFSERPLTN